MSATFTAFIEMLCLQPGESEAYHQDDMLLVEYIEDIT